MSKNNKVLFVPEGPISWGSSRMRAYWICEAWPEADCTREPKSLDGVKVLVIQQKTLKKHTKELIELARGRGIKVIADCCDPMWWFMAEGAALLEAVDIIVCSTEALAEDARQGFRKPALCIPDFQKLDEFTVKEHAPADKPVLMWHGVFINRAALWNCAVELGRLVAMGMAHKVVIVDNRPNEVPYMLGLGGMPDLECVEWRLETFYSEVLPRADIGLVPPFPGTWAKYKSNNKTAAFWCAGVPTTTGDDIALLAAMIEDWQMRARMGAQVRKTAEEFAGIEHGVELWRKLCSAIT